MSAESPRILVIDRDDSCRDACKAALSPLSFDVSVAADGAGALASLARVKPRVVVCELTLADMQGSEFMRRARETDPEIEFVMMADQPQRNGAVEAVRQGAYQVLQKPVDADLLGVVVGRLLEAHRARAKTQQQLMQSAKLASLGELAAGVAHELNNPLTSVIGFSHWLLKAQNLTPEQREDIERINKESKRCGQIVQNMLQFARRKPSAPEAIDLKAVVHDALELFRCTCTGIVVSSEVAEPSPHVHGDRAQLQQALLQILGNAKDALSGRKEPKIGIKVASAGGKALIEIDDNGCGIPAAAVGRIFDPFFSTKSQGQGAGLGLSVAYGIVKQHGGVIEASSVEGRGTKMRMELPMAKVAA